MVYVQVVGTVAAGRLLLLLLPLVAPIMAILDAGRQCDQKGQDAQGPKPDGHVQQRDAELVGAVGFFFIEARRAMTRAIAPESSTDAGV